MAFNPQDRRGSGWSGTAPKPFELDEGKELILNIDAEYKARYRDRCVDAAIAEERRREWQVLEESPIAHEGPWSYQVMRVNDKGEIADCVRIVSHEGDDSDVEAPSEIAGLPVWEVGASAFAHKRALRSVVLPDTIRRLGKKAFFCDFNLKRVVLSDAIEELGDNVFEQCRDLEEVHLPRNLRTMQARLLWDSTALRSLEIPAAVESVSARSCRFSQIDDLSVHPDNERYSTDGTCLFDAAGAVLVHALCDLSDYRVPEGCREIAPDAFKGMRTLRRLSLPEGLERIGERAFYHSGLMRIALPEGLREIGPGAFALCPMLNAVEFPSTIRAIGAEAFAQTKLTRAFLPASLAIIGRGAFEGTAIRFEDERSFSIDADNPWLFTDHSALYSTTAGHKSIVGILCERASYKVDEGTEEVCEGAFAGSRQLTSVELPEGLRVIGPRAFEGCTSLRRVNLPESLEEIGERAFYESGLKAAKIGPALKSIGNLAFATAGADHNSDLSSLGFIKVDPANEWFYLENQVLCEHKSGGDVAIAAENDIKKLRIPSQVTSIADLAFAKVSTRELHVHRGVRQVNVRAFLNIENVEHAYIDFPREIDGYTSAVVPFPAGKEKARWYLCALRMDDDGAFFDFGAYDVQVAREDDPYDVATLVLDRLDHPIKLTSAARVAFDAAMRRSMTGLMKAVMAKRDMGMFERLADYGYINEANIDVIVEKSAAWREAESTAYLMEMKRRRFATEVEDDFSF